MKTNSLFYFRGRKARHIPFYFQILFSNTTEVKLLRNSFTIQFSQKCYQERSRKLRAEQVFNQITLEERFSSRTFCFEFCITRSFRLALSKVNVIDQISCFMFWPCANVVVFGQSVLYWKVSVLRTKTAKTVTRLLL